jgi:alanine racemase
MSRLNTNKKSTKKASFPLVWAEINLSRLRHNLKQIRRTLKKSRAEILAVVKADAYGHGMKAVAQALSKEGVSFFGVANIDEALQLRRFCPKSKILVLGSFHGSQIPFYVRAKIRPTLSSEEDFEVLEKKLKPGASFPVHVKVDTGMGRLGIWHTEALELLQKIAHTEKIKIEGIYTHFAGAEEMSGRSARQQMMLFTRLAKKIKAQGIDPQYWHAANSLSLVRFRRAHLNLVRPGILLYGLNPWKEARKLFFKSKPVLSLKSRISFLKKVPGGRRLSYGGTHETPDQTYIATLPIGYSHGYRIGFSNKGFVLVKGQRCAVVGRVTMDQTLVDVGKSSSVRRWDEVTLIGEEGAERVSAEELATIAETIPYEIVCSLHSRIPRVYKGLRD